MSNRTLEALFLLFVLILSFGCGKSKPLRVVAVATLMSHPALDQVAAGMKQELAARGWIEGSSLHYVERNANQQMTLVPTIANDIASQNPDVIVAITTPMAQAVKRVAHSPLVFAAVTDPVGAGLVHDIERGEPGITGTSDAWPYKDQLLLIRQIVPKARKIGVLYNPGESASQYGIKKIRLYASQLGFQLLEGGVNSVTEVQPVAASLIQKADALFLSSDNTVIGGSVGAVKVAIDAHKPLFVGDSGTVAKGGLAAVSVGYLDLGKKTGDLVDRVLRGERSIPVVVGQGTDIYINKEAASLMGVTISPALLARATKVYTKIEK